MTEDSKPTNSQKQKSLRRRIGVVVRAAAWLNLTAVLGVWLIIQAAEPGWWPAALIVFGPRWIWILPGAVLAPIALATRPFACLPLVAAGLFVVGPIMGYRVPVRFAATDSPADTVRLRVLSLNQGKFGLKTDVVARLVELDEIDVVMLQGAQVSKDLLDVAFSSAMGWHFADGKDGDAEDLVVFSRFPVRLVDRLEWSQMGAAGVAASFDLTVAGGKVRVVNVDLPTIRASVAALRQERWAGIETFRKVLADQTVGSASTRKWIGRPDRPLIVAGDFNMTDDDAVYRSLWGDLTNAFAESGTGFGYTRTIQFIGLRIDHVLTGPGWHVRSCRVGPDLGTEHRPVIAEIEWTGPAEVFPNSKSFREEAGSVR